MDSCVSHFNVLIELERGRAGSKITVSTNHKVEEKDEVVLNHGPSDYQQSDGDRCTKPADGESVSCCRVTLATLGV